MGEDQEGLLANFFLHLLNHDSAWLLHNEGRDQKEFATDLKKLVESEIELPLEGVDVVYTSLMRWALSQIDYDQLAQCVSDEMDAYKKGRQFLERRTREDE